MKRITGLILTFSLILCCLVSCGGYDKNELIEAVRELSPKAFELYAVIYGDALERSDVEEANGYYLVTDGRYQSVAELKAAMNEVFSESYMKVISNTAFDGVSSDEGAISAKFLEVGGKLYVNPEVTADFSEPRRFDTDNIKVVKQNRFKAKVAVKCGDDELEVTLQKSDGKWKLDSSMY